MKKNEVHVRIDPTLFEDLKKAADRLSKKRKVRVSHNVAITEAIIDYIKKVFGK